MARAASGKTERLARPPPPRLVMDAQRYRRKSRAGVTQTLRVTMRLGNHLVSSVVRHRELAGEGWRQTAERLAEYLERRSTSWPG
jgi:hypothetical protein